MIAPIFDLGLEVLLIFLANEAVDAVSGDDQFGVREPVQIRDLDLKLELDPELAAPCMQDVEQRTAFGAAETMPARADHLAVEVKIDLVPVRELARDAFVRFPVVGHQV